MTEPTNSKETEMDEIADKVDEKLDDIETEEVDVSAFDLNIHVHRLLMDEPFFAALSRRMDKSATNGIPTAGVTVTEEGKLKMLYNPKFFADMTDECRKDILKHEFYHIVFQHVTGRPFPVFPRYGRERAQDSQYCDGPCYQRTPSESPPRLLVSLERDHSSIWSLSRVPSITSANCVRCRRKDQPPGSGNGERSRR